MKRIKVITYNLFYNKAFSHLKQLLKSESPDIVGIQEIEETFASSKEFLFLNYDVAISSYSFKKFGKNYYILTLYNKSSVNLSHFNYLNLPRSLYEKILYFLKKSPFPRSFTTTYFTKKSQQFLHINLHISPWSTDGEKVRQIKKIFEFTTKISLPVIITGDFNFPYGRKRLEYLFSQYNLQEATKNLIYTQESKLLKILPIRLKLDYILYRDLKLIRTERIKKDSSDHYPILSEFEL